MCVCTVCVCVCEGERAGERECLPYIIKRNWQKHGNNLTFYHIVYYMYLLVSVVVGFVSFAVVSCKNF